MTAVERRPPDDLGTRTTADLDAAQLDNLRRASPGLLQRAANAFVDSAPELLQAVRAKLEAGDRAGLRHAAHALKSSSANLGATRLSALSRTLESAAEKALPRQLANWVARLEAEMVPVLAAVRSLTGERAATAQDTGAERARPTALLVDDDPMFLRVHGEALRASGFAVRECRNGTEGLREAQHYQPEIILLDAVMPEPDGFEVCRRLREMPSMADVPIIMLTGLNDPDSVERAFDTGATGFASKPVNLPLLVNHMRFVLRSSQIAAELREEHRRLETAQRLAGLGYWRWHSGTGDLELSKQLASMCGLSWPQPHCKLTRLLEFICPEDRGRVRHGMQTALQQGQVTPMEFRLVNASGDVLEVHQELDVQIVAGTTVMTGTVLDISRQKAAEDQIRRLAYFDSLTGLLNRSYFLQRLEETATAAARKGTGFALLFFDLDGFKDVNDSFGHDIGDRLLKVVAQRLRDVSREADYVARLGGDEFCMVVDCIDEQLDAAEVADRCLAAITVEANFGLHVIEPHASLGIAQFAADGETPEALLKAADSAMYAAKESGKNRYAFYSPELTVRARQRLTLEHELRAAFEDGQFELYYQPQVSLSTGRAEAVEALARWNHPTRGLVLPGVFISVVERIGLMRRLGQWVMHEGTRQAATWLAQGLPETRLSVNISPLHFRDPGLLNDVAQALETSGLPPELLELEISESAVQTAHEAAVVIHELRKLGVRIAIDDFGSGYSSLSSLKRLPIDTLKIDNAFVHDMLRNAQDSVLMGTIVSLGQALRYTVVAEGVEDGGQVLALAGFGCDLVQGFHFSRPVPGAEIPALLQRDFRAAEATAGSLQQGTTR